MTRILVTTDDGTEVSAFQVRADPGGHIGNAVWRDMVGRYDAPLGWLGRAIRDAIVIQGGGDPERPSEKAMRLSMSTRDPAGEQLRYFQVLIEDDGSWPERYLPPSWRILATFDPDTQRGSLSNAITDLEHDEHVRVTKVIDENTGKEVKP